MIFKIKLLLIIAFYQLFFKLLDYHKLVGYFGKSIFYSSTVSNSENK